MQSIEPGWPHGGRPLARRLWTVRKDGHVMDAEINAHLLGHELRVYLHGELHYSRVHRALGDAEAEAAEKRSEMLSRGWAESL